MNDYKKFISDIIHENINISIEITDSQNNYLGHLEPITLSILKNTEIITKLTEWRNRAKQYFLTQFNANPKRTKRWLEEVVLKDNSRLLFLIYSPIKLIGNYGFKGLTVASVEIDNLIRGESGGHPRLIYYTEIALVKWLFTTFQVKRIYGFVLAGNFIVLNLHKSVGFRLTELVPLRKKEFQEEIRLDMGKPGDLSPDGLYSQKIELLSTDFIPQGVKL